MVDDLADLLEWTRSVSSGEANRVLAVLASLTSTEPHAVTALMWVLMPGAEAVARKLADLHPDVDGLVAGQLWLQTSQAHRLTSGKIAAAILGQTRREVCADLGVGELAARRDRAMAAATGDPEVLDRTPGDEPEEDCGPFLAELFHAAHEEGAITGLDYWLLWALAAEADRQDIPAHRGRVGLTAPAVVAAVAAEANLAARSLRRRAAQALDRLSEFAHARGDSQRYAEWKARHRPVEFTIWDEMELALVEVEQDLFEVAHPGMSRKPLMVAFNVVLGTRHRRHTRQEWLELLEADAM